MDKLPLFVPEDINKYFYNRTEDLKKINFYLSSLNENISQRLLITGVRGVGKTYLLQKIVKDAPKNIVITYLDVSKVYGMYFGKLTSKNFLIELLENMNNSLKAKGEKYNTITANLKNLINNLKLNNYDFKDSNNLFGIPIPNADKDYKKLSKFVMELPQKIIEQNKDIDGFIIILDEFQLLDNLENPDAFFWLVRSFNLFQSNVSYVMSGSVSDTSKIIEMLNGSTGAFGGRMVQINIKPFSKKEVKSYIEERMPYLKFTDDGFNKFYKCTRGIPMHINSFCNVLTQDVVYDEKLINETFQINMDQILVMWIRVWGSLNKYEKEILKSLLPKDGRRWSEILKTTTFSTKTLDKYLNTLQNKGILRYDGNNYSFADLMLKKYLEIEKKNNGVYPY